MIRHCNTCDATIDTNKDKDWLAAMVGGYGAFQVGGQPVYKCGNCCKKEGLSAGDTAYSYFKQ